MPEPTEWKPCDCPCDCNDLYRIDEHGHEQYAKAYIAQLEDTIDVLLNEVGVGVGCPPGMSSLECHEQHGGCADCWRKWATR